MKWFYILTAVLTWTGHPVSPDCPIEMSPPSVVVRFGHSFSVNCSSPSDQIDSMGWESVRGGTGTKKGVSSVVLQIEPVSDWDMRPLCFINLLNGFQCLEHLPVTVYDPADSVSISEPSPSGPLLEGRRYRLQCDVVHVTPLRNLSVLWHKGHEVIYTETFDKSSLSPVDTSSVFTLTAQRGDNGTDIWCEAKLDFWPAVPNVPKVRSESRQLIVLYSPSFNRPDNETLELSAGSDITLDCSAAGNPPPVYSWYLPHQIQRTGQKENRPVLTPPSVKLPGTYNCTASNSQGSATKYFTVMEAKGNRSTFAALLAAFLFLGVLLFIGGFIFLTKDGTFSFSKGSYQKGRPTSGPV